ncbi:MAG: NACHT domain-containing protein [Pseudanabaenales cyanobacterium]|nr:NACHT domain-containing protein [Pseudanabaenales cyanobacterium]
MQLTPTQRAKTDELLRKELSRASEDDSLRVVMTLGNGDEKTADMPNTPDLMPSQFPSRKAYREALIAHRQQYLANTTVGRTIEELRSRSIEVHGGDVSGVVVIETTASQLLNALDLPGVRSARFDRKIELEKPFPVGTFVSGRVANVVIPIFEKLWATSLNDQVMNIREQTKEKSKQAELRRLIIKAAQQYHQRYLLRHGQIKIFPGLMKEPIPLESIYTRVKLLDDRSIRSFSTPDALEEAYREAGKRSFQVGSDERLDGMEIANQNQYLMVLGGPGVGKSTFLRKLGLEALKREGQIKRKCVPVFIELKEFKGETLDLKGAIAKEFETCGFPAAADFTAFMLDQGKLLVLLDGLDEVPTRNFNRVIEHIEDFVDQYDKNAFVSSCRIAAYNVSFQHFSDVAIPEFDDEQIEQFIQHWFSSELDQREETAQTYWELLKQDENKATKELAQTPLLLTFLCLIYDRQQAIPNVRSTLYEKALDILLSEWAAQKRLERDPIYKGFHPGLEKLMLAEIAHDGFEQDQLFFSKDNIIDRIAEFLTDTLDAPKYLDGRAILNAIEVQQGILVERAKDTYSFSHLTLQEYLTALYIAKKRRVYDLVTHHLTDNRWREVFLLVAGLMEDDVLELLVAIDQQSRTYIAKHPKVCALIKWADTFTDTTTETVSPIAKRATALAIASASAIDIATDIDRARVIDIDRARVSAFAIAIDIDRTNANAIGIASTISSIRIRVTTRAVAIDKGIATDRAIAIDIASAIAILNTLIPSQFFTLTKLEELLSQLSQLQKSIPGMDNSSEQWRKWLNQLESTWLEALELDKNALIFSLAEAKTLQNYLYSNELLIRCKESAVRVSRKAWEDLEARLLTLR